MTTRQKPKRKYNKKIKQQIGRDLVKDTVGTNQLVDYNNFINMLEEKVKVDGEETDFKKYKIFDDIPLKRYKENLGGQLNNQQYNNDPNYQYQLKKNSKKLYKDLKESIFKGDEYEPPSTPPLTPKKRQSKFKYDDTPLTPFEIKLKAQTEENIRTKTPRKNEQSIRQKIDKFLADKSEPDENGNYKIITSKLINEWKQRFINLKGFKDDQDLVDNFSTIVLSYFDNPDQKSKDVVKRNVYINKDEQYRLDRKNKKVYETFFADPEVVIDLNNIK